MAITFSASFLPKGSAALLAAMDAYVGSWLQLTVTEFANKASSLCKAKDAGIIVTIQATGFIGSSQAYVNIFQMGGELPHDKIEQWAFDYDFTPPIGGYTPPNPPGYFTYHFPGGVTARRKTAYNKQGGMLIHRVGYFSEAVRQTLTPGYMDAFGRVLAQFTGSLVSLKMKEMLEAQGYTVIVI